LLCDANAMEFAFGLSFTVIEAPHPLERSGEEESPPYAVRRDFYSARRLWLGFVPGGTDWLHDAIEREFGEDRVWYDVESRRDSTHIGAAAEISTVVLLLMGVPAIEFARKFSGRLGERVADDLWAWVKGLAQNRLREKETGFDPPDPERELSPPDLSHYDPAYLGESMQAQLAEITGLPSKQLELVRYEQRKGLALHGLYRDSESGNEYTAEVRQNEVIFRRVGASEPSSNE
jgi:hypothetical protein